MYFHGIITYHFDTAAEYDSALLWAQSSVTVVSITEDKPNLSITFNIDTSRV